MLTFKLLCIAALPALLAQAAVHQDPFSLSTSIEILRQVPGLVIMGFIVKMFLQHMKDAQVRQDQALERLVVHQETAFDRLLKFAADQDARQRSLCSFREAAKEANRG